LEKGKHTVIDRGVTILGSNIKFGSGCYINRNCFFDLTGNITIGNNVTVGHGVSFVTAVHEIGSPEKRAGKAHGDPIVVEDGAWIGANATILPGVTVGAGSIIAACAVVTKSVQPNTVVAGIPAKRIRDLGT
jgi:acetyltransferase-like isoleucine patch superfamily enzyme